MISPADSASYPCPDCSETFSTQADRAIHVVVHGTSEPYLCNYCHFTTTGPMRLHTHMNSSHPFQVDGITDYSLQFCNRVVRNMATGQRHMYLDHQTLHRCGLCGYQNDARNAVIVHTLHVHDQDKVVDQVRYYQGGSSTSPSDLDVTSASDAITPSHSKTKPTSPLRPSNDAFLGRRYECPECGTEFSNAGLISHQSRARSEPRICPGCSRRCCNKRHLLGHQKQCKPFKLQEVADFKAFWRKLAE